MGTKVIYAEVEARNCTAELRVNGFPLPGIRHRTLYERFSMSVQHFIVEGKNELTLYVDVEGTPIESLLPREEKPRPLAEATGRFIEYEDGVITSLANGRVLGEVTYRGVDDKSEEAPRVRSATFDLPVHFGHYEWQDAPVLTLDEGTIEEARGVLEKLQDALFGGDLQTMMDLIAIKWREVDRAYPGRDDAADRSSLGSWLSELASQPERRVPLRPGQHAFRLVAGGRAIECIDEDYMPSIRILQEIEPDRWVETPYPVILARIDNALTVIR